MQIKFEVMITQQEGKQVTPRALVKIWGEGLASFDLQPTAKVWQTVSFTLAKPALKADPYTNEEGKDFLLLIVPVDLPVPFVIRSISVKPLQTGPIEGLKKWFETKLHAKQKP